MQKPTIRKFKKTKVHSSLIDNFWGADLGNMLLISKLNKRFRFLLYVIDIFSKYASVIFFLKDRSRITISNAF